MIIRHNLPYLDDSSEYFSRIRHLPYPVFLDSCQPAAPSGRFDIMSASPCDVLNFRVGDTTNDCPFDKLESLYLSVESDRCPETDELPFTGGVIASFNYDLGRITECIQPDSNNDMAYPDMQAGLYLWSLIVDHQQQSCTLVFQPSVSGEFQKQIVDALNTPASPVVEPFKLTAPFKSNVTPGQYHDKLTAIDEYIHAGDCYQVNFAQRFQSNFSGDPWHAYCSLRQSAPTPFAAYIENEHGALLSLSPERFLRVEGDQVSTKPIKGTRGRSHDPAEDNALKQELSESIKDRAENLMIVDLLRNDISKSCALGSVKVPSLFAIESFANVHHLVSTVTGKLDEGFTPIQLLKNCFPGGSITGAPKRRAMEIIEELEPNRRNIYCGSIGYISFNGQMDTSITIRTLLCEDEKIYCWGGGGIVADSDIESEYQESCTKVNNLLSTLEKTL